jgi:hypothetical protein
MMSVMPKEKACILMMHAFLIHLSCRVYPSFFGWHLAQVIGAFLGLYFLLNAL